MKKLIIILLCSIFHPSFSNDSEFYTEGSQLIPMKETRIALKKEILSLKKMNNETNYDQVRVDIYFEFYNPDEERNLTVGFVTPPNFEEGYYPKDTTENPYINNFIVMVNNEIVPYKITRKDSSKFSEYRNEEYILPYYVYYFETKFKHGINVVQHSYLFRGYGSVLYNYFTYQITTGKMWANEEIEDFELIIDPGPELGFLPETFMEDKTSIDWKIVGTGKLYPKPTNILETEYDTIYKPVRIVYMYSGYVTFKAKHFKPDYDIKFGNYNYNIEKNYWCSNCPELQKVMKFLWLYGWYHEETIKQLTSGEILLLRNLYYAKKGFVFDNEETNKIFKAFWWYIPNYNLNESNITFSRTYTDILAKLDKIIESGTK